MAASELGSPARCAPVSGSCCWADPDCDYLQSHVIPDSGAGLYGARSVGAVNVRSVIDAYDMDGAGGFVDSVHNSVGAAPRRVVPG